MSMISRYDDHRRWSRADLAASDDPRAIQWLEEEAEERSLPDDHGDPLGWLAARAEDREFAWMNEGPR